MTKQTNERTIYFNEDNHHYYGAHPKEDMSVEGLNRLVDYYAEGTQVAGILFCVNVQRALYIENWGQASTFTHNIIKEYFRD